MSTRLEGATDAVTPVVPPAHVLADGRSEGDPAAPPALRATVLVVLGASGLALLVLLLVTTLAGRQAARTEALREARATNQLLATAVVAPAVDATVLRGDAAALRRLDDLIRDRVLIDPVVRVKVWTTQGRIVYSDEPRLIGKVYTFDERERAALVHGSTTSGFADLGAAEHRLDGLREAVLEVYTPARAADGEPLLVETYSRYSLVTARQHDILRTFLPITLGALVVLQLCQLPLAASLVRRLRAGQRERERLLQSAIEASDEERRRIAGDLHDTVVQDLVGTSYVLTAASQQLASGDRTGIEAELLTSATSVRHAVRGLRSMLLEIYPAHIAKAGISAALEDLVAPLRLRGIAVDAQTPAALELPPDKEALVFRTAQEALRNVVRHSWAHEVRLQLKACDEGVELLVQDDGVGFDVEQVLRRQGGHVGLRVLAELATSSRCALTVASAPGGGTRLSLVVPPK